MPPGQCEYCRRLKREDQLLPTHSGALICVPCSEDYKLCDSCGSTIYEDYGPSGQIHYLEICV